MADKKKVFSISINGVSESVNAVKALNEQLKECDTIIKNLQNAEVKVKVSGGDKLTPKVSSGKTSTEDKVALEIEKEKTKQLQMQNDELRDQYIERERLKQANKETLQDIKDEAKGYANINDGVKTYANTLNGMSAELKSIKAELRNTEMGTETFNELTKKAAALNDKLREAEAAYGQMGRTVGRYYENFLQALQDWDGDREFSLDLNISGAENSLNDLKAQLKEAKQEWANMSPDDANFEKASKAIQSLTNQIQDLESSIKNAGDEANSTFTGRFTTTIGGVEASFSNASEACEALRKKLVAMRVAGEENTPMYQEIIQLVRRLSKEVQTANAQIAGMTKTTQNMGKVIGVMRGLSGLASLGQGIAGLFGGASEDLDKFIQRFASMTMVIAGLKELEELVNSGQGAWGKFAQSADKAMDKMVSPLSSLKDATAAVREYIKANEELNKVKVDFSLSEQELNRISFIQQLNESLYEQIQVSQEAIESVAGMSNEWQKLEEALQGDDGSVEYLWEKIGPAMDDLKAKFPELTNEIDKYVNATRQIDHTNEEAVSSFQEYQEAQEKVNKAQEEQDKILDKLSPKLQTMAKSLGNMGAKGKVAAMALYGLAGAIKMAAKATIVLAALQILAETVEYLSELLKKLWSLAKMPFEWLTFQQGEKEAKKLVSQIDSLNKNLDSLKQDREIQIKLGNVGEVEAQLKDLQDQFDMMKNQKITFDTDREFSEWQDQLLENLDKTDSDWKKLTQTEKEAAEALEAIAKIEPDFFNKLKGLGAEKQLEKINEELKNIGLNSVNMASLESLDTNALEELLDKLSDIDADLNDVKADSVKAFAEFGRSLLKARQDAASAASRIKKDLDSLTKQEYSIKLSLDATDFESRMELVKLEMMELAKTYGFKINDNGTVSKKDGGKMNDEERQVAQRIANINALQKKAAKKADDDAKKQKKEEEKRKKDEAKREAKDAATKVRNEAAARIEAMADGLDKEIALLEQKRKEEIEDSKESGKKIADINAIYDKQILEVKKKYGEYILDAEREHNRKLIKIASDFAKEWLDIQRSIEDERADTALGNAENKQTIQMQGINYDTTKGVDAQKDYYEKMRKAQEDYINEKERLDIEAAKREHQRLIEDANIQYEANKKAYEEDLEEHKRALQKKVDDAQISQEMMDAQMRELTETYHKGLEDAYIQHNKNVEEITKHGETVVTTIQLDAQKERQKNMMDALDKQRQAIEKHYNDIDKIMERTQKRGTNQFGFIDYGTYRKSLSDALSSTKATATQIEKQKAELQKSLDEKKISFDDFQKSMEELNEFAENVKDKAKELRDALNGSFNAWLGQVLDGIGQYTNVLSGMFDTINEMYTRELDAQQEALDKKQELLDEELEMIEENLQKQQEVTEEHTDKINTTEDELKNARGDRRQALIDQLAAERKAAEESIKEEKRITDEKKKNAQKQEQLKKEQDALDKKRKEQEKRAAITQSIINTFTAVSNALAVQPWFVGLALSGVALGLGMANTAQIASQKYADGGLLHGKRHSQGGMRIQGTNLEVEGGEMVVNRASTSANLPLLEYINSNRRTLTREDLIKFYDNGKTSLINKSVKTKFEEGGQLPQLSVDVKRMMNNIQPQNDDRPLVVSVVDIVNATENLQQVRVLAGDVNND